MTTALAIAGGANGRMQSCAGFRPSIPPIEVGIVQHFKATLIYDV